MNPKLNRQNFFCSVILIVLIPLVPLVLELAIKKHCPNATLAITVSIYCITVLTASNSWAWMIFSILPSIIFSGIYASLITEEKFKHLPLTTVVNSMGNSNLLGLVSYLAIISIAFIHIRERYIRHIKNSESFLPF